MAPQPAGRGLRVGAHQFGLTIRRGLVSWGLSGVRAGSANDEISTHSFRCSSREASPHRHGPLTLLGATAERREGVRKREGSRFPDEAFNERLPLSDLALLMFYCRRADKYGQSRCGIKDIQKHVSLKRNAIDRSNERLKSRGWFAHKIRRFRRSTIIVLQIPKRFQSECTFWVPLYVGKHGSLTPNNECTFNLPHECTPKVLQKVPTLTEHSNGSHPADNEPDPFRN